MRPFTRLLAIPLMALGLLACTPAPGHESINKEDMLSAAGFKKRSIKTEAQLADFRSMPAHMIRPTSYKGKTDFTCIPTHDLRLPLYGQHDHLQYLYPRRHGPEHAAGIQVGDDVQWLFSRARDTGWGALGRRRHVRHVRQLSLQRIFRTGTEACTPASGSGH